MKLKQLLIAMTTGLSLSALAEETLTLETQMLPQWQSYSAQVSSRQAATVSAQTSGRVVDIFFEENDFVEKGQVLLNLTAKEQGARVQSATAEQARVRALLLQAENQYQRYVALRETGAVSAQQLENAKAQAQSTKEAFEAAKAQVAAAKESLNYTKIYAPFSGRMTKRFIEVGESVAPGVKLFSGYNDDTLRLDVALPQTQAKALKDGTIVKLFDGKEWVIDASGQLFSFSDNALKQTLRIELAGVEGIALGDWLTAKVAVDTKAGLVIPDTALINRNQMTAVYLQSGDSWALTQVRVLPFENNSWRVVSGLKAGDVISTAPHTVVKAGK
ncbi:efflux RND transporter periplasmic adaptor subunit [Paraferrimonas sp. SM1919]|uniref:efflux RND transporter periplasmic adaptor subunit n=1 Tax=Paraferrimonas sp. SM1919 TaxID=2662263 RepID=UPI0013D45C41|nr:efflux RND transporter periplasmic adaptor subunit [Paraferrimonas sp. SM1919]